MREMQKVVVHYLDGTIVRARVRFFEGGHDEVEAEDLSGRPLPIALDDMKAILFVHTHEGDPVAHATPADADAGPTRGKPVSVIFPDGEELEGLVSEFPPDGPGFYLTPLPPAGNNRMIYIPSGTPLEVRRRAS
jgi:hypothetical protein